MATYDLKKIFIEQLLFQNLIYSKNDFIENNYYRKGKKLTEYEIKLINNKSLFMYKNYYDSHMDNFIFIKSSFNGTVLFDKRIEEKELFSFKFQKLSFSLYFSIPRCDEMRLLLDEVQKHIHGPDKIYYKNFNYNILDIKEWFESHKGVLISRNHIELFTDNIIWEFRAKKKGCIVNAVGHHFPYKNITYKIVFNIKDNTYDIYAFPSSGKDLASMSNSISTGEFEKDFNYVINEVNKTLSPQDKYKEFSFKKGEISSFWQANFNNNIKKMMDLLNPFKYIKISPKEDYQENCKLIDEYKVSLDEVDKLLESNRFLYNNNINGIDLSLKDVLEHNLKRSEEFYVQHRKAYEGLFKDFMVLSENHLKLAS
jgi:hypothetical protein